MKTNENQKNIINLHKRDSPPCSPHVGLGSVTSSRKFKKERRSNELSQYKNKIKWTGRAGIPASPPVGMGCGGGRGDRTANHRKWLEKQRKINVGWSRPPSPTLWVWVWVWATSYAHLPVRVRIPLVLLPLSLASAVASAVSSCSYILPLSAQRVTNLKMTGKQCKWKQNEGKSKKTWKTNGKQRKNHWKTKKIKEN